MPNRRAALIALPLTLIFALSACHKEPAPAEETKLAQDAASPDKLAQHAKEFAAFREERHANLRQPSGWLSLVGLYWLHEGENSAGSAPTSEIVFPPSLPTTLGKLVVPGPDGAAAELRTNGTPFTIDGVDGQKTSAALQSDHQGAPSVVRIGSVSFYLIDRQGKLGVRIKDSASEVLASFTGVETYPLSWDWRIRTQFIPAPAGKTIKVPNVLGQVADEESAGTVIFEHGGKTWQLEAMPGEGEDGLYFVFGDGSNGHGTYGGGRFLEAKVEGGDRKTAKTAIVDFNYAYNPPCVFTPYATCPLPPAESKIDLPILAGEKVWGSH